MLDGMPSRPAPPRVHRTFAFVDLCGFTDFADERGDDEAADILHLLRASLREAATNHGIRVDKWLGDGAMLVGVESPAVLAAVVEAKWALDGHSVLALRGGIAAGPVMVFEGDDYVGGAVNLAAKLCDLAEAGQCLAQAELADACPVGLAATPVGAMDVPGFHRPMELVAVDASTDEAGNHRRGLGAALGRSMRDATDAEQSEGSQAAGDSPA
jgi:class 3 adenylate cyclase